MTLRLSWLTLCLCSVGCVNRSPVRLASYELKAKGTASFAGQFQEVFDAAFVALEQSGQKVEIYPDGRYFTMTGSRIGDVTESAS